MAFSIVTGIPGLRTFNPIRFGYSAVDPEFNIGGGGGAAGRLAGTPYTSLRTIRQLGTADLAGKVIPVRLDLNVPMKKGVISDDTRIRAALPTIKFVLDNGGIPVLMSHLGDPHKVLKKAKEKDPNTTLTIDDIRGDHSLAPVARRLAELLGRPVEMAEDCVGEGVKAKIAGLRQGDILLLENLRWHKGETKNDPAFIDQLDGLFEPGGLWITDAFGTVHRENASMYGVPKRRKAYAGFLVKKELEELAPLLYQPKRPFVAILGGAKISDKIGVIESLLDKADIILIGGGMAYTFLAAYGYPVGKSLCEREKLDEAKRLLALAEAKGKQILLPVDHVIAADALTAAETDIVSLGQIPEDKESADIGPRTIFNFMEAIDRAGTVFWNGPMGYFENEVFSNGTYILAQRLAENTRTRGLTSIIGGGDSAAAIEQMGFAVQMTHISTGGGASLEFLEGKMLPGVAVLLAEQP